MHFLQVSGHCAKRVKGMPLLNCIGNHDNVRFCEVRYAVDLPGADFFVGLPTNPALRFLPAVFLIKRDFACKINFLMYVAEKSLTMVRLVLTCSLVVAFSCCTTVRASPAVAIKSF